MNKLLQALRSRMARNIYFWLFILGLNHMYNTGNDHVYHYGNTQSPWYWHVFLGSAIVQLTLVYTNNLLLIPKLLYRRKYTVYVFAALILAFIIAVAYALLMKIAVHLVPDITSMQLAGMTIGGTSDHWTLADLFAESMTWFISNIGWLLVFTMAWHMNDYSRQRRIAAEALQAQATAELAFLKSQLNPHFLFNTLNNLYALAMKQSAATPEVVLKLSAILRYMLYESNHTLADFEKEKEIMMAYIELELLRIKDHSRLHFSIQGDRNYQLPPLLWLPLLENVFKHGARIIGNDMFVEYHFQLKEQQLVIETKNHCKHTQARESGGIGLANLRKRLEILYSGKYTLEINSAENIFTTRLVIQPV